MKTLHKCSQDMGIYEGSTSYEGKHGWCVSKGIHTLNKVCVNSCTHE